LKPSGKLLVRWVLALQLSSIAAAESDIDVTDSWASEGIIILEGDDWTAKFQKGPEGLSFVSGENRIAISPKMQNQGQPLELFSGQIRKTGEESSVALSTRFRSGRGKLEADFLFKSDGSLRIMPGTGLTNLAFSGDIGYGVLPGLYLEDVIFDPEDYDEQEVIRIPSESLFWTLLGKESGILVLAWEEGDQSVRMVKNGGEFSCFEFSPNGKAVYLKLLSAPGIWHKERSRLKYLEKDVELGWRRPFDAQWKTQLLVNNVPTTWLFDRKSPRMWLPMLGFFRYPVWFDGPATMVHLSKKIPPKGDLFIYPLAKHSETPLDFVVRTPVGKIIEERGQRIHIDKEHSDLVPNVGYVHCWGTSIMQRTIYKYGLQAREKELLNEHIDYCVDYVNRIQRQSLGYYAFILEMKTQLAAWVKEVPEGSQTFIFLEQMQIEIAKVEEMYHSRVERGGRKTPEEHMAYAQNLGQHLKELIQDAGRESYPEAKFILDTFNALAAATDEDVPAGFGITIRRMFQKAGYACADTPEAVDYAEEIRKRIWQKTKTRNYETTGL
jgi:hypothetical protein